MIFTALRQAAMTTVLGCLLVAAPVMADDDASMMDTISAKGRTWLEDGKEAVAKGVDKSAEVIRKGVDKGRDLAGEGYEASKEGVKKGYEASKEGIKKGYNAGREKARDLLAD